MKKRLKFVISGIVAFVFFFLPQAAFASTLSLSPGSGSISIGATTSVQVRLNSGEAVNGVSAFLSYPADKLDVAWVSPGSAFAIEAENTYGGGIIKISRGSISGVSGNVNVATIGFRGKSAGSATVSFIGGSAAPRASDSSDSLSLGGSSGGVYNVTQSTAQTPQSTKSPAASGNPEPAAVKFLISDIKTTAISSSSASVTWKTNAESDSLVEYGLEKDKYFLSASNGALVTDHKVNLENSFLTPGLVLHFRVRSKDTNGQEAVGDDRQLQLLGYQVKIRVTDELGNPVSGVEVLLYSDPKKAITDAKGEAVFENMSPGKHLAVVKSPGGDKSAEIEVLTSQTSIPSTTIKINKLGGSQPLNSQTLVIVLIVIGIAVVVIVTILLMKRKKGKTGSSSNGIIPPSIGQSTQSSIQTANPSAVPNGGSK